MTATITYVSDVDAITSVCRPTSTAHVPVRVQR